MIQAAAIIAHGSYHPLGDGGREWPKRCWSRGLLREWQLSGLLEDYADYARGEASSVLPTVKEVTGREARDVATFARDNAAAFGGRYAP